LLLRNKNLSLRSRTLLLRNKYRKKFLLFKEGVGRIVAMPIIKSAKKALRQTRSRAIRNKKKVVALRQLVATFKKQRNQKNLNQLYSLMDKMVKDKIFHKNKAGRLKSMFSKTLVNSKTPKTSSPVVKKAKIKNKK